MSTATMTERDLFAEAFEAVVKARSGHEPGRLAEFRKDAIERFSTLGFPTTKLEEWRVTNVSPIAKTEFSFDEATTPVGEADISRYRYDGMTELVFVNGRLDPELSRVEDLPPGVVACSLEQAWLERPDLVEPYLGRYASFENHAFVALNSALHVDGAFIYFPKSVISERPVHVLHVGSIGSIGSIGPGGGTRGQRARASFPRNLFVAEENAQGKIIEQFVTAGTEGNYLVSPVTEAVLGPNAVVDHYKLQRESIEAFHMATVQIQLDRASNFSSQSISWGGGLVRNDVNAVLDGEGCEATLNGLYMVEGNQLVDNHMRVDHAKPNCDSHELFKGILEGRARAVFNGRIYVHPDAQKTDAKQTNRNLLLSPTALVNSNPQLEIFADDVKCTHGSTVGQLDDIAVFYLRSRGIGEEAARSLLTYAFAADIVERIRVPEVRRDLEEFLFRRLPRGEVVRQAV